MTEAEALRKILDHSCWNPDYPDDGSRIFSIELCCAAVEVKARKQDDDSYSVEYIKQYHYVETITGYKKEYVDEG